MKTKFVLAAIIALTLAAIGLVHSPSVFAGPCNPQQQQC
jgi:hypothetical protein